MAQQQAAVDHFLHHGRCIDFTRRAIDTAIETVANGSARPIVHSDRGAHYRWSGWLCLELTVHA